MEQKRTIIGWIMVAIVCLIGLGFFFMTKTDNNSSSVQGLSTAPSPTVNLTPSERALKAATYVYFVDSGKNKEWINKSFPNSLTQSQIDQFKTVSKQQGYSEAEIEAEIERKQEEEAITKLALWLDANSNYLVEYEVAINKHQQSLQNQYVQQPVQSAPNNSQIDDLRYQVGQQERELKQLQQEQQTRDLWDSVCAVTGQQYNSFVGGGCR